MKRTHDVKPKEGAVARALRPSSSASNSRCPELTRADLLLVARAINAAQRGKDGSPKKRPPASAQHQRKSAHEAVIRRKSRRGFLFSFWS
jgi:hypothetical protein